MSEDGEVYGWGEGYLFKKQSNEPVLIPTTGKVVKIAAGSNFAAAIAEDGLVYTWGEGGSLLSGGKLGHGSSNNEEAPR